MSGHTAAVTVSCSRAGQHATASFRGTQLYSKMRLPMCQAEGTAQQSASAGQRDTQAPGSMLRAVTGEGGAHCLTSAPKPDPAGG